VNPHHALQPTRISDADAAAERTRPYLEDANATKRPYAEAYGKYTLCLKLAAGSSSVVYLSMFRGTDGLQRPVIIKRLHAYLANRVESVEMFFDEAQLAAVVSHPAVCALHDFGRSKQTYFLAMEYLIGETLERVASQLLARPDQAQMERVPLYQSHRVRDL
jgi:serine/threonine protein kinase